MFKFKGNNKKTIIKQVGNHKTAGLMESLRALIASKLATEKQPLADVTKPIIPSGVEVAHIAVVIDGVVQDVLRAQNRFAAILLSGPEFVEFNPAEGYPKLNETKYIDGRLVMEATIDKED